VASDARQDRHIMSQTALERRDFPVPMRWPHTGSDPSRPGHALDLPSLIDPSQTLAGLPIISFQSRRGADPPAASCRCYIHPPARRRYQIPIAPAAPPVPNFPRLRALALFGRRPPQRVEGSSCRRPKTCTDSDISRRMGLLGDTRNSKCVFHL
jgi:hypothetical protein